jgi:hypothetical protein
MHSPNHFPHLQFPLNNKLPAKPSLFGPLSALYPATPITLSLPLPGLHLHVSTPLPLHPHPLENPLSTIHHSFYLPSPVFPACTICGLEPLPDPNTTSRQDESRTQSVKSNERYHAPPQNLPPWAHLLLLAKPIFWPRPRNLSRNGNFRESVLDLARYAIYPSRL